MKPNINPETFILKLRLLPNILKQLNFVNFFALFKIHSIHKPKQQKSVLLLEFCSAMTTIRINL